MGKSLIVLDTPDSCVECPCRTKNLKDEYVCNCLYENNKLNLDDLMHRRPYWCPLKEVPKEKDWSEVPPYVTDCYSYMCGWNSYLDKITSKY